MYELELVRSYLPDRTIGKLSNGLRTLERPWLDNKVSVSCIPEGIYTVKRDRTGRFQFYAVQDVPGRTFIEFHGGVYPKHSEGCILIGNYFDKQYNLQDSSKALNRLMDEIGDASFKLTIRSYDPNKDGRL